MFELKVATLLALYQRRQAIQHFHSAVSKKNHGEAALSVACGALRNSEK